MTNNEGIIASSLMKNYQFKAKFGLTFTTGLFVALFLTLSVWQWHRAGVKRAWLQNYQHEINQPEVPLTQLNDLRDYRRVKVQGHFDNKHTILLDNQLFNHQPGYFVLTPFFVNTNKRWILVNRGWVSQGTDRKVLPSIELAKVVPQVIHGQLKQPQSLILLGEDRWSYYWPIRVQAIDFNRLSQRLKRNFYFTTLLLSPHAEDGFERHWKSTALTQVSVSRHLGYAVQWLLLAIAVVVLYLYAGISRRKN